MFRIGSTRTIVRATLGATALGGGGLTYSYWQSDANKGVRRSAVFWRRVAPVVFDYYWHVSSRSPYVRYQAYRKMNVDKDEILQQLHATHAPDILNVMLELKSLYVKLGQVLSVTMLPIPEPYRKLFRTLQDSVPPVEFASIQAVIEDELGRPVEDVFEWLDPQPVGAASIGQAHRATLRKNGHQDNQHNKDVILKVQYPDSSWQIPADIQCVGDFLKLCVYFGVVDQNAAQLSFQEFSRQFLLELDYLNETKNIQTIHAASVASGTYQKHGVKVPEVYPEYCTDKIITMEYLDGKKLEETALQQLESLGMKRSLKNLVRNAKTTPVDNRDIPSPTSLVTNANNSSSSTSWTMYAAQWMGKAIGVDTILWSVRWAKQAWLYSQLGVVASIQWLQMVWAPPILVSWADRHRHVYEQTQVLNVTKEWVDALMDVHGHQIFVDGCFNADCHPGNILVLENKKLGLIDFGQCKRLTVQERHDIAKLVVAVANDESDDHIASTMRHLGMKTKNDSTEFLSVFAKLLFGKFESHHLDHSWHKKLHELDQVTYFPNQLSMVYRTSMLLRGLAVSLQRNVSIGEHWKEHAQFALENFAAEPCITDPAAHHAAVSVEGRIKARPTALAG